MKRAAILAWAGTATSGTHVTLDERLVEAARLRGLDEVCRSFGHYAGVGGTCQGQLFMSSTIPRMIVARPITAIQGSFLIRALSTLL
jgi:hypothetical protein